MRWGDLIPLWLDTLAADGPLAAALGGPYIYPASSGRATRIPSVEYLLLTEQELETFNPFQVQVDLWAAGIAAAAAIEARIRARSHRDTAIVLVGERIWIRLTDARQLDYPADPGVMHRQLDLEFNAVRSKYFHALT